MASASGRMTLVTVDQVISGASNILVVIFIAHLLSPGDFGRFTLIFLVYSVAGVVGRSLIGSTILVHPEDADSQAGAILGSSLLFALAVGAVCLVFAVPLYLLGSGIGSSLIWLGALVPMMLVQDIGRFLAIAVQRPAGAIWLDSLWILLEIGAFALLIVLDRASLPICVAVWAASGTLAGFWVFVQRGLPMRTDLNVTWLRSRWDFSWRSMVTGVTSQASALIGFSAVAVVSSEVAVGAVRAANLLTRPGNAIINGLARAGIVDMSRERPDNRGMRVHVRRALLVSVAAAVANTVVLVLLPDSLGRLLLGQTWDVAAPLLLAAGLQLVLIAARNGIRVALMSRLEIRLIMMADIIGSVALIVLSFVGAVIADAQGVMWAGVAGQAALSVGWWFLGRRRLGRGNDSVPASPGEVSQSG